MRAIEFKSKLSKNRILIPKKIQSELHDTDEKNVRVMIFWEEETDSNDLKSYPTDVVAIDISHDELESINRGLRDFEEGKIHSDETARKLYEKYL